MTNFKGYDIRVQQVRREKEAGERKGEMKIRPLMDRSNVGSMERTQTDDSAVQ